MNIRDRLRSTDKSRRKVRRKFEDVKGLSITSLLDVLTIILVFLIKNVSTESVKISAEANLMYPTTITNDALLAKAGTTPIKIFPDKIIVGTEGLQYGSPAELNQNTEKREQLFQYLKMEAQDILRNEGMETCLIVQADNSIPCGYITEIVDAATSAGYSYIYFATLEDADWLQKYNVSTTQ